MRKIAATDGRDMGPNLLMVFPREYLLLRVIPLVQETPPTHQIFFFKNAVPALRISHIFFA